MPSTMHLGLLGLPKSGKTTLFNLLTSAGAETDKFSRSSETHRATARVPDSRLAALRDLYEPRRYVEATIDYIDIPGVRRGEGSESLDLPKLKEADALLHVVRAFDDPEILHPEGSIDPLRDLASIDLELILADLELCERRLERLDRQAKGGLSPREQRESALLRDRVLPALESETPLRELGLEGDDEKLLRGFQLLSAKPQLVVFNVGEDGLEAGATLAAGLDRRAATGALAVSAALEEEIAQLPEDEQRDFLADLGLDEPSVARVQRASYELLGLISFFTVGDDEVRAWTLRRGSHAREAAGAIHTDIERGFIRAEVVPWDVLLEHGSMAACREKGVLRLEGKEYQVADGEVVHFRFNV